jgi:hypothetical protein
VTDVLVDGRVIPVPPGWTIRVILERIADEAHPVTVRGGDAAYNRRDSVKEPHDSGARPAGTEHLPTIDELDPLPVMARRNGTGRMNGHTNGHRAPVRGTNHGKLCPECNRRCGPASKTCPACDHRFVST